MYLFTLRGTTSVVKDAFNIFCGFNPGDGTQVNTQDISAVILSYIPNIF